MDELDEADDDIEEIRDRLIDEEPAVVMRKRTPATGMLLENIVIATSIPLNVRNND